MWGILAHWHFYSQCFAVHPHACGVYASAADSATLYTVHPHACGVYDKAQYDPANVIAVHPHACGVYARIQILRQISTRFIPTHVGYTFSIYI